MGTVWPWPVSRLQTPPHGRSRYVSHITHLRGSSNTAQYSIRTLYTFLNKKYFDNLVTPSFVALVGLGWFSIIPTRPLPSQLKSDGSYTETAQQLAKFVFSGMHCQWKVVPASSISPDEDAPYFLDYPSVAPRESFIPIFTAAHTRLPQLSIPLCTVTR